MMARWMNKPDPKRKTGSMVIWLKEKATVEKLLREGTALFGPNDAFCSQWERTIDEKPCYKCSTYGDKQANGKNPQRCSGAHHVPDCTTPKSFKDL